ncbi:MAG TPA: hypothetical protein VJQ54_07280 [Candidatus Sulfotelmatobacter sp.]|nr:hypothetical protein [Candidatus Sulfotelmatobacter sp.]
MKRAAIAVSALTGVLLGIICLVSPWQHPKVHASSGCSLSTLTGSYGFTQTGFFTFPEKGGGGYAPTADVGVISFDGAGQFTANFTDSTNGKVTTGLSAPGTYTVNPDCTGTLTIVNVTSPGENSPYTTVIVGGGAEMMAIAAQNEATQTVIIKKQ